MRYSLIIVALGLPCASLAQTYANDIHPLLDKRCGGCHAAEAKMGEFSVNSFETLMRGGNHGRPVLAGKPEESLLYQIVTGKAYPKMPMDGTTLSDGETELIRKWILAGAPGPTHEEARRLQQAAQQAAAPVIKPRAAVKPQIFALAWHPGGRQLALGQHRTVKLATTGATGGHILEGHADMVRAVAFRKDGGMLAAGGGLCARKGEVKIWNVESRSLVRTITGHDDCIYGLAFSPDGKTLATSSYDKLIKLWDLETGKEIRTLKDHIDAVYAIEFTPDGKRLVSGAADRSVKVWDTASGRRLYTFSEATDGINTVAIDPTGRLVAAGGLDKSVRVWRMDENGGELLHSLTAHEDAILKLAWAPDGKTIVSSSADRTLKILHASDLTELRIIPKQSDWAYGVQFSPDGRQLAVGRVDGTLTILDVAERMSATTR
jgi:dipeptidyl aminopeptidase/acylaminoacyl peptidase